jgi:aminopeptidase C
MKRNFILLALLLISISVISQNADDLTIDYLIQTSEVKNQYNSNACWSFSSTSFLEAELKRMYNLDIVLSPMFFIHYNYAFQAENYLDKNGSTRFSPGGLAFHALDVYDKFGFVPIDNYEVNFSFTSYKDFELYKKCDLPVPANWKNQTYYNLPLEEFIAMVNYAIENGFTLLWDGDVSEYPIITNQGVDFKVEKVDLFQYPNDTLINDELRQLTFNDKSTTEDHNSHIVGIAMDKNDNKYYILKDSNGQDNFAKGFIYISENYLALKTISLIVHKDGVPDEIKNKLITN